MDYMHFTEFGQPIYDRCNVKNTTVNRDSTTMSSFLETAKPPLFDNMHLFSDHDYQLLTNLGQNFTHNFGAPQPGSFQQVAIDFWLKLAVNLVYESIKCKRQHCFMTTTTTTTTRKKQFAIEKRKLRKDKISKFCRFTFYKLLQILLQYILYPKVIVDNYFFSTNILLFFFF